MAGTLLDLLADAVAADPGAPAILYRDEVISFGELDRRSRDLAGGLAATGLAGGDRLLLCLQNVPGFVIALIAAARIGITVVPVNPMYRSAEIGRLVDDCGPAAIVCDADQDDGDAPPGLPRILVDDHGGFSVGGPAVADAPADPLMLVYTSGTTGQPKGAVISHANLLAGGRFYRDAAGLTPDGPILGAAPLFHVTGLSGHIAAALTARAPLILCHRFRPDTVLDAMERHRPVFTVAAITALAALIDAPAFAPDRVASLKTIFSGGAPIPPAMRDRVAQATGVTLRNVYGLTETVAPVIAAPAAPLAPVDAVTGALSIGRPVAGVDVRLVDDEGVECPDGTLGEIVVTGPSVVAGYWRAPQATADSMRDDGFHTGDVGVRDADGWLYLVDRKKDMIVASGFKVWPREVEDALYAHPAVREAAVVGIPDAYRGETVKAVISLHPGARIDPADIDAHCRRLLAAYKVPRIVEIVDALPRTATGKILRRSV